MVELTRWIVGGLVAALLALVGVIWNQLHRRLDNEVKAIWDQIGRSSEEGMRKTVHSTANRTSENGLRLSDQDRRLQQLERKVFNGHRQENER